GRAYLTDLRSRNGTRLNGKRIEPGRPIGLENGDIIEVGPLILMLQPQGGEQGSPSASSWEMSAYPGSGSDPQHPTPSHSSGDMGQTMPIPRAKVVSALGYESEVTLDENS